MPNPAVLGIDLGGTKIAAALVGKDREVYWEDNIPTMASAGLSEVVNRIKGLIEQASNIARPSSIGLGSPGPLNIKKGLVVEAPNLGWSNVPIVQLLKEISGLPVYLENDANAAALGEQVFGAGAGFDDLVYITVSTGIGAGFVLNGRLLQGRDGGAGEIGHNIVVEDGPLCGCGRRGCLEAVASGTAIARMVKERLQGGESSLLQEMAGGELERISTKLIGEAAQLGDPLSLQAIRVAADHLGKTVSGLVNTFNPGIVVIGGGVANLGGLLFEPVREIVRQRSFASFTESLSIVPAALGGRAGVLGAAAVAMSRL